MNIPSAQPADGEETRAEPAANSESGTAANASGSARIYQADRDQYIAERDLHLHYSDRTSHGRRVDGPIIEQCPYPGLAAFGPKYAAWFFGRDRILAHLLVTLAERLSEPGPLVVVAPSGAGKSSLLRAGLHQAIELGRLAAPGSRRWPRIVLTPTAHPLAALAAHLEPLVDPAATSGADGYVPMLRAALDALKVGDQPRIVLVIDQFEEVFTLCQDEGERQEFIRLLSLLSGEGEQHPVALVVLGLRADFYTHCAAHDWLREALQHGQVFLGPMSQAELRQAIVYPAEAVGLEVEPDLVERLLRDLGADDEPAALREGASDYEAGRLPLLAHALRATWQQRSGHVLTIDGYELTGGIQHAVATTAERVFERLDPGGKKAAEALFLRLVAIGDGTQDTRRRVLREDLAPTTDGQGATRTAVDAFTTARLLTMDRDAVTITHEALLKAWPRLHRWINDDRTGNLIRQELHDDAAFWDRNGRDHDTLYRGNRLDVAKASVERTADYSSADLIAHTFIAASTRRERRAARIRRGLIAVLATLAIVASAAAAFAFQQRTTALADRRTALAERATAVNQRDQAELGQIAVEAGQLRQTYPSIAAQLDLAAYRMQPSPATSMQLISDAAAPLPQTIATVRAATGGQDVFSLAFSPDGRTLASATGGTGTADHIDVNTSGVGAIQTWDVADPAQIKPRGKPVISPSDGISSLMFSPDGRVLAGAGDTGYFWNASDLSAPPATLNRADASNPLRSMVLSPDGHTLASTIGDGTVQLWSATNGAHPKVLDNLRSAPPNADGLLAPLIKFSPNGRMLAVADDNRSTIRLWDVSSPANPKQLSQPIAATGVVYSLAFSPDGHTLAVGNDEGNISLWDPSQPNYPTQSLGAHSGGVFALAFMPDGKTLISGGSDNTIRLWDVASLTPLSTPLAGPPGNVTSYAFSPDGLTLASGNSDGTIRLWHVPQDIAIDSPDPTLLGRLPASLLENADAALSPNQRVLATALFIPPALPANFDPPAPNTPTITMIRGPMGQTKYQLWDIGDPAHPKPLSQFSTSSDLASMTFSPNGRTFAAAETDNVIRLWDVGDPTRPTLENQIPAPREMANRPLLAFSPDGHVLADTENTTIRLLDVSDPARPKPEGQIPTGYDTPIPSLFSPNGHTLVAVGTDPTTVQLWDVTDPAHPKSQGEPLASGTSALAAMALSPSGRTLADIGADDSIQLWDISDATHPKTQGPPLVGTLGAVRALLFSPDGQTLTSSATYFMALHEVSWSWDLNTNDAVRRICAITRSDLTPALWQKYLPQLAYNPPC